MTTYVYGSSDDLIEIEGDLREEFSHMDSDPYYLGFSDGTLLKVTYDGDWNIKLINGQAYIFDAGHTADAHDGKINVPNYSDFAILPSDLTWVVGGTDVIK